MAYFLTLADCALRSWYQINPYSPVKTVHSGIFLSVSSGYQYDLISPVFMSHFINNRTLSSNNCRSTLTNKPTVLASLQSELAC